MAVARGITVSLLLSALAVSGPLALSACADNVAVETRAAAQDAEFMSWLDGLLAKIQADPKYRRLPLDTEAQSEEFLARLHAAYRDIITTVEFTAWAAEKYPGHDYELGVITRSLPE